MPGTSARILKAFAVLRDSLPEAEIARILADPYAIEIITQQILSDKVLDQAFAPVQQRIQETTAQGMSYFAKGIPLGEAATSATVIGAFNVLNPDVITAIQTLNTKVIQSLKDDVRESVRASIQANLEAGKASSTVAREIRHVIGLGPSQVQQVENYRQALIDGKSVSQWTLRDKRMNPKTPAQIEKAVAAYRQRRIAQNAQTVAKTATLDAFKQGQDLSWRQAVDRGIVDGTRLTKRWSGVGDDRERPSHIAMEGDTVPYDQPYSNNQMFPGQDEYGCRCLSIYAQSNP